VGREEPKVTGPATSHLSETESTLIAGLYPSLRAFASVVAPVKEDPNDLVQEALVRTLRGGPISRLEHPKPYLRTAIYHLAVSAQRHWAAERGALVRIETAPEEPHYSWQVEELLQLTPKARTVVYLRVIEGMSHDEIAALLGCSTSSVRKTASRAKRQLRRLLAEEVNDATA
jgi:RNA polymerase sigma factor (sigma-70 family)